MDTDGGRSLLDPGGGAKRWMALFFLADFGVGSGVSVFGMC